MTAEREPSTTRERWLRAGIFVGVALVVVPFVSSLVGIARVSKGPEGLRGATHRPEIRKQVGFALGSTEILALLAFPGVVLGVSCGLALMEDRRKREDGPDEDEDEA